MPWIILFLLASCAAPQPQEDRWNAVPNSTQPNTLSQAKELQARGELVNQVAQAATGQFKGPKNAISGKCQIVPHTGSSAFSVPCRNLLIRLLDSSGKEAGRSSREDGTFEFLVEKKKEYKVSIDSKRYILPKKSRGPFRSGDRILLNLIPRKTK